MTIHYENTGYKIMSLILFKIYVSTKYAQISIYWKGYISSNIQLCIYTLIYTY